MKRLLSAGLLLLALVAPASAWRKGIYPGPNGYLAQTAFGNVTRFTFIDQTKLQNEWAYQTGGFAVNIGGMNAYGFPTSAELVANGTWQGGIGVLPPSANSSGYFTVDWVGYAEISLSTGGDVSCPSGSCGSGCTITGSGTTSATITGTNCYATVVLGTRQTWDIVAVGDGVSNPILSQMRYYDQAYACAGFTGVATSSSTACAGPPAANSRISNCYAGSYIACLNPFVVNLLSQQFGVIHYENVEAENTPGNTFQATWEQNTPVGWYSYQAPYYPPQNMATGTVQQDSTNTDNCVNSPCRYTLAFTGYSLTNKMLAIAQVAQAIPTPNLTTTSGCTALQSTCTISFSSVPGTIVTGMYAADITSGHSNYLFPTAVVTAVTPGSSGTITLSCLTPAACPGPVATTFTSGESLVFSPMLNINSTGFLPLVSNNGHLQNARSYSTTFTGFLYDSELAAFMQNNYESSSGCSGNGCENAGLQPVSAITAWPAEIKIAWANALRMHPHYNLPCQAMDAHTDYATKLAQYNKNFLGRGLIPHVEGTDEVWNFGYACTTFAGFKQFIRDPASDGVGDNADWYGQGISQAGQDFSTVYGLSYNTPAATRAQSYWIIAGMQNAAGTGIVANSGSGQDIKVSSPWYASNAPSTDQCYSHSNCAAYNWITHVAIAPYYSSTCTSLSSTVETALAYLWNASALSLKVAAATFLNYNYGGSAGTNSLNTGFGTTACGVNVFGTGSPASLDWIGLAFYNGSSDSWGKYIAAWNGSPNNISLALTEYEGGYETNQSGFNTAPTVSISSITTGSTTTLTTGETAADYICTSYSAQCGASGPLQITVSGTGCTGLTSGTAYYVVSTTSTTVTIEASTSGSCSGGSFTYTGSTGATGWFTKFELAVQQDTTTTNLQACELAALQLFYALNTTPGITAVYPSIFDWSDSTNWGRYNPTPYSTASAGIAAAVAFNGSQTGSTTCNP